MHRKTRTLYHGTDKELNALKSGSYVTMIERDAQKFGYRRAVMNGSPFVRVYRVVGNPKMIRDMNRDRSFVIQEDVPVELVSTVETYATLYKLKNFGL